MHCVILTYVHKSYMVKVCISCSMKGKRDFVLITVHKMHTYPQTNEEESQPILDGCKCDNRKNRE